MYRSVANPTPLAHYGLPQDHIIVVIYDPLAWLLKDAFLGILKLSLLCLFALVLATVGQVVWWENKGKEKPAVHDIVHNNHRYFYVKDQ